MNRSKFFLFLLALASFASLSQSPNCTHEGIGYNNHQLMLNNDSSTQPRLYLIRNTSPGTVILNHPKNTPGAGAGWMSHVDKDKWSAIGMNQSNFSLSCMLYAPPKLVLADCQNVISVCAISPKNPTGNYWIVENKSLTDVIKLLEQKALLFPPETN